MNATISSGAPSACRRRLTDHYGPAVTPWLTAVPELLTTAADRWQIRLTGYHDAGCASVLATGHAHDGRPVLIKAWYDRCRYAYETRALQVWPQDHVPQLLARADDLTIAALETIAGRPGGAPRPSGEYEAVALGLNGLHATTTDTNAFPSMEKYLWTVVLPRIERRVSTFAADLPRQLLDRIGEFDVDPTRPALLHGDLYRENVLFDDHQRPVFIDPLPMVGDPAFDWAFWVVYYDLLRDPVPRLRLASAIGGIPVADLVPVCLTLCIDGLLYYRETGDPREPRMLDVATAIVEHAGQVTPC